MFSDDYVFLLSGLAWITQVTKLSVISISGFHLISAVYELIKS
jgi:hypothetical protein